MMTDVEILKALKKDYEDGRVSVLVGSGFTKNAYAGASNWAELLKDMVNELYGTEITNKTDYKEILRKKGYLKVVDEYIESKGCREAIEVYIEEHIPYVYTDKAIIRLTTDDKVELHKVDFNTHIELISCDEFQNIFTTNYDNFLEFASTLNGGTVVVIKSGYELSNYKKGTIIKIHGSLVENADSMTEDFEFDGDKSRRYIISSEDYRDYKQKHEALSSYMRIALLTGKFCLIGFSGDDPNYREWLNWVKDILDKKPESQKGTKEKDDKGYKEKSNKAQSEDEKLIGEISDFTKVYLIDLDDRELTTAQKLYNQNHHISVIRLGSSAVTQELKYRVIDNEKKNTKILTSENKGKTDSIGSLFCTFFRYLREGIGNQETRVGYKTKTPSTTIVEDKESISQICRRIIILQNKNRNIDEEAQRLLELRTETRYVADTERMATIAFYIQRKSKRNKQKEISDIERYVFLLAMNDCGGLKPYMDDKELRLALLPKPGNKGYNFYLTLRRRERTLQGECILYSSKDDKDVYENVLRCMYTMNFSTARKILNNWKPKGGYIAKKTSLNQLFKYGDGIEELGEYIKTAQGQEKYLAENVHDFIGVSFPSKFDFSEFKNKEIGGFYEITKNIFDKVTEEKKDIDYYGHETEWVMIGGNDDDPKKHHSMRLLNFLAGTGILPVYGVVNVMNAKNWYAAFSYLVEDYPYPCLFYSSMFDDKKISRRIGEDYIYSKKLYGIVPDLLSKVMDALTGKDTYSYLRIGLLRISAEFYEAVKEDLWIDEYIKLLKTANDDKNGHPSFRQAFEKNIQYGMANLQKRENISRVLTECLNLMLALKDNKDRFEGIMPHQLPIQKIESLDERQAKMLKDILSKELLGRLIPLMTKLKHYNLLPEDVVKETLSLMSEHIDENKATNYDLYNIARFSIGNDEMLGKVRKKIIDRNIWIPLKDKGRIFPVQVLPIIGLRDLGWTDDELTALKSQIKEGFEKLSAELNKEWAGLLNYDELLRAMYLFLDEYKKTDEDVELLNRVKNRLDTLRGWKSLDEAFYSDKPGIVEDVLKDLNYLMTTKDFSEYKDYFDIVLGNVVRKRKPKLSDSLLYVARVLHKNKVQITQESSYVDNLKLILKNFDPDYLREDNLIVRIAMPALISIAEDLGDNLDKQDEALDKWLADDLKTRYNNDYRDWVKEENL